ncbi:MAG: LON peptidase substrate-binding domain-containing protein, partial [Clostridia bacterium]|nr:LON peptidase substrate-binding domain-containing protein [Clostridia bacterium]
MQNTNEDTAQNRLPLIPLRGIIAYPEITMKLDIDRDKSIAAIENALKADQRILLAAQRDSTIENPTTDDVYATAIVATIKCAI